MKISPMRLKMDTLRAAINLKTIDQLEIMLNNSKGTGTTNLLIKAVKDTKIPILVESEAVAEHLTSLHPDVTFHPYSKQLPGQLVMIDVSTIWVLCREAQKVRKLGEDLLNWMEHKNANW